MKQNSLEKTFDCSITGCSPKCPFFPNAEGEIPWHYGEDGLKHRDETKIRCGYNGSYITSWNRICPMKEDKLKQAMEKEMESKNDKLPESFQKAKNRHKRKINKQLTKK